MCVYSFSYSFFNLGSYTVNIFLCMSDGLGFMASPPRVLPIDCFTQFFLLGRRSTFTPSPPHPPASEGNLDFWSLKTNWLWSNIGHLYKLIKESVIQIGSFTLSASCGSLPHGAGAGGNRRKAWSSSMVQIKYAHTPCITGLTTSPGPGGRWLLC